MRNFNRALDREVATKIMGVSSPVLCLFYTTHADADYCVLHKVREEWGNEKRQMFLGVLHQTYAARTKDPGLLFMQYQPGDYARAALKTLELVS